MGEAGKGFVPCSALKPLEPILTNSEPKAAREKVCAKLYSVWSIGQLTLAVLNNNLQGQLLLIVVV